MRKKKTGMKKKTMTGKKTSGARRKAQRKALSSILPVEFVTRFVEA